MSDWKDVDAELSLIDGENIVVDVDGVDVAVFRVNGGVYAIQDVCSHDGGEIASGVIEGEEIICPRHGARFCIKTGKVTGPPAYEDIPCYTVRIENGRIQVKLI